MTDKNLAEREIRERLRSQSLAPRFPLPEYYLPKIQELMSQLPEDMLGKRFIEQVAIVATTQGAAIEEACLGLGLSKETFLRYIALLKRITDGLSNVDVLRHIRNPEEI